MTSFTFMMVYAVYAVILNCIGITNMSFLPNNGLNPSIEFTVPLSQFGRDQKPSAQHPSQGTSHPPKQSRSNIVIPAVTGGENNIHQENTNGIRSACFPSIDSPITPGCVDSGRETADMIILIAPHPRPVYQPPYKPQPNRPKGYRILRLGIHNRSACRSKQTGSILAGPSIIILAMGKPDHSQEYPDGKIITGLFGDIGGIPVEYGQHRLSATQKPSDGRFPPVNQTPNLPRPTRHISNVISQFPKPRGDDPFFIGVVPTGQLLKSPNYVRSLGNDPFMFFSFAVMFGKDLFKISTVSSIIRTLAPRKSPSLLVDILFSPSPIGDTGMIRWVNQCAHMANILDKPSNLTSMLSVRVAS